MWRWILSFGSVCLVLTIALILTIHAIIILDASNAVAVLHEHIAKQHLTVWEERVVGIHERAQVGEACRQLG